MNRLERQRLGDWVELAELMQSSHYYSVPFKETPETRQVDIKLEEYRRKYKRSFDVTEFVMGAYGWKKTTSISPLEA
jgi:hypothetical protein